MDDFTNEIHTDLLFNAVMGVTPAESGLPDTATLLDATQAGSGAPFNLDRHAAAGLASADSGICYRYTVGQVISIYRDGVGADDGPLGIGSAKALLETANQSGCPLGNNYEPPDRPKTFCLGNQGDCPCLDSLAAGCGNSTNTGARLDATGTGDTAADDLVLVAEQLPANETVLFLMARAMGDVRVELGSGLLCLGGIGNKIIRLIPPQNSGAGGSASFGPGIVALSCSGTIATLEFCIEAGETWNFQAYYRDQADTCGNGANTTNAVQVEFF